MQPVPKLPETADESFYEDYVKKQSLPQVYLQIRCPLCQSQATRPVISEQNYFYDNILPLVRRYHLAWIELLECKECGFGFTKEMPAEKGFFEQRYDLKFLNPEAESKNTFKDVYLDRLLSRLPVYQEAQSPRLLDIGSFAGILMRRAKNLGYDVEGVELNPGMAEYCQNQLGLTVFNGSFDLFPEKPHHFDAITMIDVLEHLWNPAAILEKAHRLLKPGGLILIKVPNFKPQLYKQKLANRLGISSKGIFENYGHVNHFSPQSLGKALERGGFDVLESLVVPSENLPAPGFKSFVKNRLRNSVSTGFRLIHWAMGRNIALNFAILAQSK